MRANNPSTMDDQRGPDEIGIGARCAYGHSMERDQLAQLLDGSSSVSEACRRALAGGAELLPAYERRRAATVAQGTTTVGFPETLAALRYAGKQRVQLGQVTTTEPPYMYMVFLSGDPVTVVACLGIDKDRRPAQTDQPVG
jgi:hypothetical protein